jgi:MerR family transcriptional regulator, heat shock protein HspR
MSGHPREVSCTLNEIGTSSAMANMAIEVAKLRIEVDALISENPPKSLAIRRKSEVIIYKEDN